MGFKIAWKDTRLTSFVLGYSISIPILVSVDLDAHSSFYNWTHSMSFFFALVKPEAS